MKVQLNFSGNMGYGADQVSSLSLADLRSAIEEAIEEFGEDADVVMYQVNNGRGANYGEFCGPVWELFSAVDGEDDEL